MKMVSRESCQIVGFDVAFDKSPERIQKIVDNGPEAQYYCTDGYFGYIYIVYRNVHDKSDTFTVEGINADFRHYIPILARRSRCFPRKIETLKAAMGHFLGNTLFDNLIILWYNEEEQIFEKMPTTRNAVNSTVSTTTTHFYQYRVVDSVKWYENLENSLNRLRKMWIGNTSYQKNLHTIFLLDCSANMEDDDKIHYSIEIGYNGVTEDNYQSIISDMDSPGDGFK